MMITELTTKNLLQHMRDDLIKRQPGHRLIARLNALIHAAWKESSEHRVEQVVADWAAEAASEAIDQQEDLLIAYDHISLWEFGVDWIRQHYTPAEETEALIMLAGIIMRTMGNALEGYQTAVGHFAKEQEKATWTATHDQLTGLGNRRGLLEMLPSALARADRAERLLGIMMVDLNDFKPVNDVYGHEAGDFLLERIGKRVHEVMRNSDYAARLGGDEFVMVLESIGDMEDLHTAISRIRRAMEMPVQLTNGISVAVKTSIGVTIYPFDDNAPDKLLRHADQAMYTAKKYKNTTQKVDWRLFHQGEDTTKDKHRKSNQLVKYGQIIPYYQPVVDLKSGTIVGMEALARIQDTRGVIHAPEAFIESLDVKEHQFLATSIISQALFDTLAASEAFKLPLWISANVSPNLIIATNWVESMQAILAGYDIAPARITLEVQENKSFPDIGAARESLEALRAMGIRIALDDVGNGYSSIMRVKNLPIDEIKLDQDFVRGLMERPSGLNFVSALRDLARDMNIGFIAEGVESLEIMDAMAMLDVPKGQGFAIARPMPAADLAAWFTDWKSKIEKRFPAGRTRFGMYAYHNCATKGMRRMIEQRIPVLNHGTIADVTCCPVDIERLGDKELSEAHAVLHRTIGTTAETIADGGRPDWHAAVEAENRFNALLLTR
ncbi:hypothetical protein A4U49_05190 [Acidithiobacillus ferrivorans]|uniref:putative bifunctional diguanylate cyclase/phosphodiesterase n=1 Tax=Acidithiobacillus ferrivorans TaxID=160808 RepID=UPI00089336CD|nr:EAL domain-containing protein [Acidithiobacillus ferrivorans]OFA16849.1 hypothetical protein A4U49_05190 [Acidithiobacillus ferrivorans]